MSNIKTISAEEFVSNFTKSFASQADKLFSEQESQYLSPSFKNFVGSAFIKDLIDIMASRTLRDIPVGMTNNQEQYEYVQANFGRLKMQLQDAIAEGMGAAMSEWTGKEIDYYCQIKPHPVMHSGSKN